MTSIVFLAWVLNACAPADPEESVYETVLTSSTETYLPDLSDPVTGPILAAAKRRWTPKRPRAESGTGGCHSLSIVECKVFRAINAKRADRSLPPLRVETKCLALSQAMADDMARNRFFSHESPKRGGFPERAKFFRIKGYAGENIAMGGSPQTTVEAWMDSPGHRRNILNAQYLSTGIGHATDTYGQPYYVQCFSSLRGG